MKVNSRDHAEPAASKPAPGQFQRVLQQAGAPSSSRPHAPPRPPLPPAAGQPTPRHPQPPRGSAPPPMSTPRPPIGASPLPTGNARPPTGASPPSPSPSRLPGTALASSPLLATSRSALASPENLGQARQAMHGEAFRLRAIRTEAQTGAQEKTEHRLTELISRELTRELRADSSPQLASRPAPPPAEAPRDSASAEGPPTAGESRPAAAETSPAPPAAPDPQLKVQATLRLIEKIELFVQSQRPALRMSLGSPLSATVELERTGPREVALRIQGRHGPLAQEDLARIRDGLEARGLRLRSLSAE